MKQLFISEYRNAEKSIEKTGVWPRIFQAIWVFLELEHFANYFFYNTRKKNPAVKNFRFFFLETLKNMLKEKFYPIDYHNQGSFPKKLEQFFPIFEKKGKGDLPFPPSSWTPEKAWAGVFKKTSHHRYFLENCTKFSIIAPLKNTSGWLLSPLSLFTLVNTGIYVHSSPSSLTQTVNRS